MPRIIKVCFRLCKACEEPLMTRLCQFVIALKIVYAPLLLFEREMFIPLLISSYNFWS